MHRRSFIGSLITSALGLLGLRVAEKPRDLSWLNDLPGSGFDPAPTPPDQPVALFLCGPLDGLYRVMPHWFTPDTYTERVPVNDMMVASVIYDRGALLRWPYGQSTQCFVYRLPETPPHWNMKQYRDKPHPVLLHGNTPRSFWQSNVRKNGWSVGSSERMPPLSWIDDPRPY
jgi:hypothetical protein